MELLPRARRSDTILLHDLVSVLMQHPNGLRRWSIMRAMRTLSERANREVTPKFEDDVERAFRRHCSGDAVRANLGNKTEELFHRPKEAVGEVWAVHAEKAQAFLDGQILAA